MDCYTLSAILLALSVFVSLFYYRRRHVRLPPGTYGLPFIGETLQLIAAYKTENPEPFIDERVNRFGPIFTSHVFGEPTIFSADPEMNRFVLQNEGKLFVSSYPSSITNLLGKQSLLLMRGSLHKRMHSLIVSFATSSVIRDFLLEDINRLIRLYMDTWTPDIFLIDEAKKITFAITIRQLMSFDPCAWSEVLCKEYLRIVDGFFSIPSPFLSSTYRRAIEARAKVVEILTEVVRERRKESERGEKKKDMLESLLDTEGGGGFSDEEIVDFIVALLVAGYETTSASMALAVKFLTETPLALAQLKEEHEKIRASKGPTEHVTWNDYKAMPFTHCVVNETLRMANIIGGIFRRTTSEIQVKGYTIPKGWKIFVSFRGVHMNDEHFNDARTFNPWRWQSEKGAPPGVYTPFGGGPRFCPGFEIAKVIASVFLHYFVTEFRWKPTGDDKLAFFPTTRTRKMYPLNVERIKKDM